MTVPPAHLSDFPRAILHVDFDAFFASVEQVIHPEWRGRPVITGRERGIVACPSYEAKALGVRRGMSLAEAQKFSRDLILVPSDYETYSLFSRRLFDILRRFTPMVEEYSIDEAFADLTGLRRVHRAGYDDIARRIKDTLQGELGLTVSVGLSLSKSLAKLCSKHRKPDGFTVLPGREMHPFLAEIPLGNVWGFGPNTTALLQKHGLSSALDYIRKPEAWARKLLGKPGWEIWHELQGTALYPIDTEPKSAYATICKGKTFSTPAADREFVYAKLVRNLESAFIKLRRHNLRVRELTVLLRQQDYVEYGLAARLTRATAATAEAVPAIAELFAQLFRSGTPYRTTTVILGRLESGASSQLDLFEDRLRIEKMERVSQVTDAVNAQFGKHTLSLGPGLFLPRHPPADRDLPTWRKTALLAGETSRQRLAIPRLAITPV